MTVKELIRFLSNLNPDLEVWMSSDPEGNGYFALSGIGEDEYIDIRESSWGHVDDLADSEVVEEFREDNEDSLDDPYQSVVVLWP